MTDNRPEGAPEGARASGKGRIGGLDTLRGLALIAMASYHLTWDLELFGYLEPGTATEGLWKIYARSIAGSFLFLAGFSLYLAHGEGIRWRPFGKRLAMIAAAAAAITVATAIVFPSGMIFFGILHNIAAASLIGLAFLRLPAALTLLVAALVFVAPHYLASAAFNDLWLAWIGLSTAPPRSNDYVPLLPWLAPFLAGLATGKIVAPRGLLDPFRKASARRNLVAWAGRHSLVFYLLHQPVLISLVYLASQIAPPAPADPVEAYKSSCVASCVAQNYGAELCQSFCGCTLEKLQAENLFEPMMADHLVPEQQTRIGALVNQCSQSVR